MFKIFLAASIVAFLAAAPGVRAADTPEQSELRQLLRKKNAQPPTQAARPVAAPAPQPKPAPAPIKSEPATVVPVAGSSTDYNALRQALRQGTAQPTTGPEPTRVPSQTAPMAEAGGDPNALRNALRQELGKPLAEPPAAPPPSQAAVTEPPFAGTPAPSQGQPVFQPAPAATTMQAPALPISGTKEQRLAVLLSLYKADALTPEQYHTQRAAILAEP